MECVPTHGSEWDWMNFKAPPTLISLGFHNSFPLQGSSRIGQWGLGTVGMSSPSAKTHM